MTAGQTDRQTELRLPRPALASLRRVVKMVFAKDDLALVVMCFTKKSVDWYSNCKRISKEVIENLAEIERLCQSEDIHC